MGGIAGPIQQVGNTAGQIPQTANVDFGFNPTQNVPFRPQQIPGMAPHVVASLDEFRRMNMGQPQVFPAQVQGMSIGQPSYGPTSQEAYNYFTATAKPAQGGSLPSYEQFVQNRSAPRPFLGPQRPMQPQMPQVMPRQPTPKPAPQGLMGLQQTLAGQQPVDPRRLVSPPAPGLNGVPGNQNPLYFGPGKR